MTYKSPTRRQTLRKIKVCEHCAGEGCEACGDNRLTDEKILWTKKWLELCMWKTPPRDKYVFPRQVISKNPDIAKRAKRNGTKRD